MARDDADYNPVTAQGKIEKPAGVLGRRRLRQSLPPVEYGHERVFVDADGQVRSGRGATTAGERYWASPGMWLNVDTGDHDLTFRFTHREADGTATYDVKVEITARVVNAEEAVRRNITGVRRYAEPLLSDKVGTALAVQPMQQGSTGVRQLNIRRDEINQQFRTRLPPGSELIVGKWLAIRIVNVSAQFDAATTAHHDGLVTRARRAETAVADIEVRKTWSNYLTPQMADPLTRAVATIAADPSQANIRQVASQLDADDRWRSGEVINILNTLIKENYVDDINQLNAIKAIVETLQRTSAYEPRQAVVGANDPQIGIAGAVEPAADEPVTAEFMENSDTDWNR
jgi:hypothetical protein